MTKNYQTISELKGVELTETLKEYVKIKNENKNCVVLFQIGEFYEAYLDDALVLSSICSLYLTKRKIKTGSILMAGIPTKALEDYIAKLVENNYKVLVCAQVEDENKIKREIKRIYTKGTIFEDNLLNSSKNNYIVAIYEENNKFGLAKGDISTGDFSIYEGKKEDILSELEIIEPSELLLPVKTRETAPFQIIENPKPDIEGDFSSFNTTLVKKSFFNSSIIKGETLGHKCANAIIEYSKLSTKNNDFKIPKLKPYNLNDYMSLNSQALLGLELFKTKENEYKGSFLWGIDETKTPMGKRLLNNWVKNPLKNIEKIEKRQEALIEFSNSKNISDIKNILKNCYDIKRLWGKLTNKTLTIKDLLSLKSTIEKGLALKEFTKDFQNSLIKLNENDLEKLKELYEILDNTLSSEEDEILKDCANGQIAIIKKEIKDIKEKIKIFEEKERKENNIKSLKVLENKMFGYFIEINNKDIKQVPNHYKIRQNLSNTSRYLTDELVILNEKLNSLSFQKMNIEQEIIKSLKDVALSYSDEIYELGNKLSTLDVINSFYEVSKKYNCSKPKFKKEGFINFKNVKHPLGVRIIKNYIPNDFIVNDKRRFKLLTGPNMAGKSTYMKSVALNIILAQIGSFTFCDYEGYIFDKIFVHSRGEDFINRGESTFMAEMLNVKNIIENSTEKSFIIFDELGIGTSTLDGVKLAFSISKYVIEKIKCTTIFATHFHKLKILKETFEDRVQNLMIGENFDLNKKEFERHVSEGFLSESYGLNVIEAIKMPEEIIKTAKNFEV